MKKIKIKIIIVVLWNRYIIIIQFVFSVARIIGLCIGIIIIIVIIACAIMNLVRTTI